MRLFERGRGRPRVAVVGGIHGDEPAGEAVVDRLVDRLDHDDLTGTVQLLVANEPALAAGKRYLETDLNRAFPGDPDGEAYEDYLASRVYAILEDADAVLALHTSRSVPPPFAVFSDLTPSVRRSVTGMPVEYVADVSRLRDTTLDGTLPQTVGLEAGAQGDPAAADFGTEAALAFLRAHGVAPGEPTFRSPRVVRVDEELPKGGGTPRVHYRNFEEVPEGEVFAEDDVYTHRADVDGRVPVLASEDGYDDLFGLWGVFDGTLDPPEGEGTRG